MRAGPRRPVCKREDVCGASTIWTLSSSHFARDLQTSSLSFLRFNACAAFSSFSYFFFFLVTHSKKAVKTSLKVPLRSVRSTWFPRTPLNASVFDSAAFASFSKRLWTFFGESSARLWALPTQRPKLELRLASGGRGVEPPFLPQWRLREETGEAMATRVPDTKRSSSFCRSMSSLYGKIPLAVWSTRNLEGSREES